ncbi:MAG: putative membrane protein YdjX (TVP38/TMEM64 family) [Paraglaciecola sp.]|jgi:uncharacterized membrane protein YdjX (TVP38/TMEM64 family)
MTKNLYRLLQYKVLKKALLAAGFFVVLGLIFSSHSLFESFNEQWIDAHIRHNGLIGPLYFIAIGSVTTALGGPRQVIAFLGGYTFGVVNGAILSTLAAAAGCALCFYFARKAARPWVKRLYPGKISVVNRFLHAQPFTKTIVIRLLPIGSNVVTNLVAGVTDIKARYFISGSLLGYLPQMAIFALMGKGIVLLSAWKITLSVILFIISSLLGMRLYRQHKNEQLLQAENTKNAENTLVQH